MICVALACFMAVMLEECEEKYGLKAIAIVQALCTTQEVLQLLVQNSETQYPYGDIFCV